MSDGIGTEDVAIILLATYNGQRYLPEQIDSLLAQTHLNLRILVRDDESTDETLTVLSSYVARYPQKMQLMRGPNLGFVGNFLSLIAAAPRDAAAYFFCDQDDIWLPDKVAAAMQRLKEASGPVLYFGRLTVVDESLQTLQLSPLISRWSFGNALLESQATGCTIAVNPQAMQLLQLARPEAKLIVAHDWWAYLVIIALGQVIFDSEPRILYRQHEQNSLGVARSRLAALRQRWAHLRQGRWGQRRPEPMMAHFLELYRGSLNPEQVRLIEAVSLHRRGYWAPLGLYVKGAIWRRGVLNQIVLLCMLLFQPMLRRWQTRQT